MSRNFVHVLLGTCFPLFLLGQLAGQAPNDRNQDPTQPSQKLRDVLRTEPPMKGKDKVAEPPKLPVISVKGRAVSREGKALALLNVDGKIYFVSKGSAVSTGTNMTLLITEVSPTGVRIEVQPNNLVLNLR